MKVEDIDMSTMEIISVARSGTTWRGLLKGDFTAMASALRAAIERNH